MSSMLKHVKNQMNHEDPEKERNESKQQTENAVQKHEQDSKWRRFPLHAEQ